MDKKTVAKQRSRTKKPVASLRSRGTGPSGGRVESNRAEKEALRAAQRLLAQY